MSAWNQPFHYWLPLLLGPAHARTAIPLLRTTLVAMIQNVTFDATQQFEQRQYDPYGRNIRKKGLSRSELDSKNKQIKDLDAQFDPLCVLKVFPKLMNNMVVALMKEDEDGKVALHASEKALLGYCSFHHILLKFGQLYPEIHQKADFWMDEFMSHESRRVKAVIPGTKSLC